MEQEANTQKIIKEQFNQLNALRANETKYLISIREKWQYLQPDAPHRIGNICNLLIGINSTLHYIEKDLDEKIKEINSTVSFIEKELDQKFQAKAEIKEENGGAIRKYQAREEKVDAENGKNENLNNLRSG